MAAADEDEEEVADSTDSELPRVVVNAVKEAADEPGCNRVVVAEPETEN